MYLERSSSSSRFTQFSSLHHKEKISDMYNHECVLYNCNDTIHTRALYHCIMIVLLVRGVRGDCSGPSDGNCARISEEREDSIRPVSASSGAGARLLPSAARDPHTGHDHSYEHRGPGVNSSVLQFLAAKAAQ